MPTDPTVSRNAYHHDQLLESIEDAARRLGVRRSTIYNLLNKNELEAVKIGRARRVVIASAVNFVERLRSQAVA